MNENSKTRKAFPLSKRKIVKKTLTSCFGLGVLLILVLLTWRLYSSQSANLNALPIPETLVTKIFIVASISIVLIAALNYLYQVLYFNSYYYELEDDFIVIRKGVIMPREITIPYERVQDIYVDQDLFDRLFGIYDVHLSTATWTSGMEAHIDGVARPAADGLREKLLKTIGEKIRRKPVAQS